MFSVNSITARTHDSSYGGYKWRIDVTVTLPVAEWTKCKRNQWLGQLYGIDIGNYVYRVNPAIPAHNPSVDDRQRASRGIKTVSLTYYLNDPAKAERLGLTVKRLRNGDVYPAFGDYVKVL